MADLNYRVRGENKTVSISLAMGGHHCDLLIGVLYSENGAMAMRPVFTASCPRDVFVTEPPVSDIVHEVIHMLSRFVCDVDDTSPTDPHAPITVIPVIGLDG